MLTETSNGIGDFNVLDEKSSGEGNKDRSTDTGKEHDSVNPDWPLIM